MSKRSFLYLLFISSALLVIAIISVLIQPRFETKINKGENIFKDFNSDNIRKIKVNNGLNELVINKDSLGWVMQNKYNYKVKDDVVRENLIQVNQLRFFEKKTEDPSLYSRLNLHYPNDEEGNSKLISIFSQDNEVLSEFILGKTKKNGVYIRKKNHQNTWLTNGILSMSIEQNDWLETKIFDIKNESIKKIELNHSNDTKLIVSKKTREEENFIINNLPKGETPKSDLIANFLSYFLSNLVFDDVMARQETSKENFVTKAKFELFDNIVINALVYQDSDKKKWIDFDIDSDSIKKLKANNLIVVEDIEKWSYKLPKTKYNTINTKLNDLLVED